MSLATILSTISTITVIGGVAGGGYWFAKEVPTKEDIKVVELKVEAQAIKNDFLYDTQITDLSKKIGALEAKPNKTQSDYETLRIWSEDLKTNQKMRSVK